VNAEVDGKVEAEVGREVVGEVAEVVGEVVGILARPPWRQTVVLAWAVSLGGMLRKAAGIG
jgi:hypothetical protein